jgi:hypothetical protein
MSLNPEASIHARQAARVDAWWPTASRRAQHIPGQSSGKSLTKEMELFGLMIND